MPKPLYDALKALSDSAPLRLHMPGHKGLGQGLFRDISRIDYTEITPTGNLYTMEGPIGPAEDLCARFAGAEEALFFSCGSTQGIYTMLAEAVGMGGTLLLERGCHKSVYQAMALLDITPRYFYAPRLPGKDLAGAVTETVLQEALEENPDAKAVFLTSPTYYGVISQIVPLARLCHSRNVALLVDEAHGAHFPALGLPSAAAQGADLSVVSTHKTWPALGSSAVLYVGKGAPFSKAHLKETATLFGTTSPSYPILASIDYGREALEGEMGKQYEKVAHLTENFRKILSEHTPFSTLEPEEGLLLDPCRLTIDVQPWLSGFQAAKALEHQNIFVEMADQRYLVCILTCCDDENTFERLLEGLKNLPLGTGEAQKAPELPPKPIFRCSIRQALLSPDKEKLPLFQAVGRIAGEVVAPYPPGIPIIAPGEEITEKHIAYLQKKSYNIREAVSVFTQNTKMY
jgi:arginine/lysine/ornithine decarboxylase